MKGFLKETYRNWRGDSTKKMQKKQKTSCKWAGVKNVFGDPVHLQTILFSCVRDLYQVSTVHPPPAQGPLLSSSSNGFMTIVLMFCRLPEQSYFSCLKRSGKQEQSPIANSKRVVVIPLGAFFVLGIKRPPSLVITTLKPSSLLRRLHLYFWYFSGILFCQFQYHALQI